MLLNINARVCLCKADQTYCVLIHYYSFVRETIMIKDVILYRCYDREDEKNAILFSQGGSCDIMVKKQAGGH